MANKDIICIIGHNDGKPVWHKIGVFIEKTKSGKPMMLIDRTFCAAGVIVDEGFASAALYLKDQEPYDPKAARPRATQTTRLGGDFADFDDDIPF